MHTRLMTTLLLVMSLQAAAQKSNEQVEKDLFSLAKTFGYLRYFYPGDEAAALDWDRFAFYAAKKTVTSSGALQKKLNDLFSSCCPAIEINTGTTPFDAKKYSPPVSQSLQPIYWQHLGDGKGVVGYPYKSLRINRMARVLPESQNDFSGLRRILDANDFKGKEIRVSALFKANPFYNGQPDVMLEVTDAGKDAIQLSSRGQGVSAEQWTKHVTTTVLPATLEKLNMYVLNIGMAGGVDIDEVKIELKENDTWKTYFSTDFAAMDEKKLRDNWTPFGINQDISMVHSGNESFVRIVRTKGPLKKIDSLFSKAPARGEIITKKISNNLFLQFPLVLQGDDLHTYPISDTNKVSELSRALSSIDNAELKGENLYTRIANVMIMWNKMQHFYPEFDHLKLDWDASLRKALHACFVDRTTEQHRVTLTKMLSPLKDSHMTFYYTTLTPDLSLLPLQWQWIENQLVITAVLDSSLALQPGDIVTHVGNTKAADYWKSIKQQVFGATDARKDFKAIEESLQGEFGSNVDITTRNQFGAIKQWQLERNLSQFEYSKRMAATKKTVVFEEVTPGIFYINLNKISWADLEKRVSQLVDAKGLVFDLRAYPTWESIYIASHLFKQPIHLYQTAAPAVIYPDRKNMDFIRKPVTIMEPRTPYLQAPCVFLTGGGAISYAEDFMGIVENYHLAEIVGEPTAGTTGGINTCYLLGGLFTSWTGLKVYRQDNKSFNANTGVVPHHPVKRTIKGVRNGTDEYLEYALKNIFKIQ